MNKLRGLLYEFGIVLSEGHRALLKELPTALHEAQGRLPDMLIDSLDEQVRRINGLEADIAAIERRLSQQLRETPARQTLAEIPGVGLLTATAIIASMGSPTAFKDAREFAAWIGLVPRQTGTGGRARQLGISKRGDAYLRTLLIHGARSIVRSDRAASWPWLAELLKRRALQHRCSRRGKQVGENDLGGACQGSAGVSSARKAGYIRLQPCLLLQHTKNSLAIREPPI